MFEYLKIAWRNIWRNKRRTLITAMSVFFAVFLSIIMRGFMLGEWGHIIDGVLHSYTGYIQVHTRGYWDDKTFDYSMEYNDTLYKKIASTPNVKNVIPRIESFALASSGDKTKGIFVSGIDPEKENPMTNLKSRIVSGSYLNMNDTAVMLSQKLSVFLNLKVNDTIILISQGYQGNSAAGKYPIKAIVKLPSPEFDNKMVFMPIPAAQDLYSCQGRITSLVIDINKPDDMKGIVKSLRSRLDASDFEIMDWTVMANALYQQFKLKSTSNGIILFILYVIVGFGVFGTVLMMTNERIREFGIMISIGMQKMKLASIIALELVYIVLIGLLLGMAGSIPILYYYHLNPIQLTGETARAMAQFGIDPVVPVLWQAGYILKQGIAVFILIIFSVIYPLWHITRLNVSKALKS